MKVVSLFSGCGGTDIGLIKAGHEIVFANDFNKWACKTYEENIGNIVCCNIEKIKTFPNADVLVGCCPCQGFSVARRKGTDDPRNYLYLQFARALSIIKPRYFITENVKGLLSARAKRYAKNFRKKI